MSIKCGGSWFPISSLFWQTMVLFTRTLDRFLDNFVLSNYHSSTWSWPHIHLLRILRIHKLYFQPWILFIDLVKYSISTIKSVIRVPSSVRLYFLPCGRTNECRNNEHLLASLIHSSTVNKRNWCGHQSDQLYRILAALLYG